MNLRLVGSILGGAILWYVLFIVVGVAFGLVWPDYQQAARLFFETEAFSLFTMAMMLTNFLLFSIAGLVTGWLVTRISGGRRAAVILGGAYFLLNLFNHYYRLWGILPDWYNLVVPWVIAGSIYLGSIVRQPSSPSSTS